MKTALCAACWFVALTPAIAAALWLLGLHSVQMDAVRAVAVAL